MYLLCNIFINYFSFIYVFYYIPRAWYWKTRVKCTILVNLESILSYLGETSLLLTFLEFHEKVQFWRSTVYFTIDSGGIYSTHHDASSMDSTKMSSPCCNAWYLNCSKQIVALMLRCDTLPTARSKLSPPPLCCNAGYLNCSKQIAATPSCNASYLNCLM